MQPPAGFPIHLLEETGCLDVEEEAPQEVQATGFINIEIGGAEMALPDWVTGSSKEVNDGEASAFGQALGEMGTNFFDDIFEDSDKETPPEEQFLPGTGPEVAGTYRAEVAGAIPREEDLQLGVRVKIFAANEWIDGVITDGTKPKWVEVGFMMDGQQNSKKIPRSKVTDKIRVAGPKGSFANALGGFDNSMQNLLNDVVNDIEKHPESLPEQTWRKSAREKHFSGPDVFQYPVGMVQCGGLEKRESFAICDTVCGRFEAYSGTTAKYQERTVMVVGVFREHLYVHKDGDYGAVAVQDLKALQVDHKVPRRNFWEDAAPWTAIQQKEGASKRSSLTSLTEKQRNVQWVTTNFASSKEIITKTFTMWFKDKTDPGEQLRTLIDPLKLMKHDFKLNEVRFLIPIARSMLGEPPLLQSQVTALGVRYVWKRGDNLQVLDDTTGTWFAGIIMETNEWPKLKVMYRDDVRQGVGEPIIKQFDRYDNRIRPQRLAALAPPKAIDSQASLRSTLDTTDALTTPDRLAVFGLKDPEWNGPYTWDGVTEYRDRPVYRGKMAYMQLLWSRSVGAWNFVDQRADAANHAGFEQPALSGEEPHPAAAGWKPPISVRAGGFESPRGGPRTRHRSNDVAAVDFISDTSSGGSAGKKKKKKKPKHRRLLTSISAIPKSLVPTPNQVQASMRDRAATDTAESSDSSRQRGATTGSLGTGGLKVYKINDKVRFTMKNHKHSGEAGIVTKLYDEPGLYKVVFDKGGKLKIRDKDMESLEPIRPAKPKPKPKPKPKTKHKLVPPPKPANAMENWTEYKDVTGRSYYFNSVTNKTQWEAPLGMVVEDSDSDTLESSEDEVLTVNGLSVAPAPAARKAKSNKPAKTKPPPVTTQAPASKPTKRSKSPKSKSPKSAPPRKSGKSKLKEWGMGQYWEAFSENDFTNARFWGVATFDYLTTDIGMTRMDAAKFLDLATAKGAKPKPQLKEEVSTKKKKRKKKDKEDKSWRKVSVPTRAPTTWTHAEVAAWVANLAADGGMKKYGQKFYNNCVTGQVLGRLSNQDLEFYGIKSSRKRQWILSMVKELFSQDTKWTAKNDVDDIAWT